MAVVVVVVAEAVIVAQAVIVAEVEGEVVVVLGAEGAIPFSLIELILEQQVGGSSLRFFRQFVCVLHTCKGTHSH